MQAFTYQVPTRVIFGRETEQQAGPAVQAEGGSTVLVLYGGGSAVRSGLLGRVTASLTGCGLRWYTKGGIQPNPVLRFVCETLEEYRDKEIDFILGVGGGSVLDTAKALAAGLPRPEVPVWDYYSGKEKPITAIPVGAVLTIAAAGSETSDSTVLTNEATQEKRGFNAEWNRPRFAILNPELTYTLPPYQTACGVADILMHTLDRYFSDVQGNELTDALAEAILRTTVRFGKTALVRPDDYEARSELMWCGSLSHNNLTGLGQAGVDPRPRPLCPSGPDRVRRIGGRRRAGRAGGHRGGGGLLPGPGASRQPGAVGGRRNPGGGAGGAGSGVLPRSEP